MKTIIFIPPNGTMYNQDFSIQRVTNYLFNKDTYKTVLLKINKSSENNKMYNVDKIINVTSQDEILETLKREKYDYIFHRSWMGAYSFAALLSKNFNNVIVNIKDWNFATKKEYSIMLDEKQVEDFDAITSIFSNSKKVLSHYSKEQALIWSKNYRVDIDKFIFFPEYCNEENFNNKKDIDLSILKLVYAGSMCPNSFPESHFPCKSLFRSVRLLSSKGIEVNYVLVKSAFDATQDHRKELFLDILYEDKFNKFFNLKEGKSLDSSILNKYHYGFFHLEDTTENQGLTQYAVPSKFAFYLEAGLPILINEKWKTISALVKKYNLGIVFSNEELDNLDIKLNKISQSEYLSFIESLTLFRNTYTYSSNIDRVLV